MSIPIAHTSNTAPPAAMSTGPVNVSFASATAASSGSDLNGAAIILAALSEWLTVGGKPAHSVAI